MGFLIVIGKLILEFIVGTLVLWLCSSSVKTEHANIKTAAIYNAIMMVLDGILLGIALIFFHTESDVAGVILRKRPESR